MKNSQPSEPKSLQNLMDQAERSGFGKMSQEEWKRLRTLAEAGLPK
jgi:hypothetical protein